MPGDTEKYLPLAAGFFPQLTTLEAAGIGAAIAKKGKEAIRRKRGKKKG